MNFLLGVFQNFDYARIIIGLQGLALLGFLGVWLYRRFMAQITAYILLPMLSWWILIAVGTFDTLTKLGEPTIEWWRSPSRSIAYAIGLVGVIYNMQREAQAKKKKTK